MIVVRVSVNDLKVMMDWPVNVISAQRIAITVVRVSRNVFWRIKRDVFMMRRGMP